jgi:hypothetical protein
VFSGSPQYLGANVGDHCGQKDEYTGARRRNRVHYFYCWPKRSCGTFCFAFLSSSRRWLRILFCSRRGKEEMGREINMKTQQALDLLYSLWLGVGATFCLLVGILLFLSVAVGILTFAYNAMKRTAKERDIYRN